MIRKMAGKRLASVGVLAAGAALAVVPLTATTSSAATAEPAKGPVQTRGMEFYDDYWKLENCEKVGRSGEADGKWSSSWVCEPSPWDYDLYVDYT